MWRHARRTLSCLIEVDGSVTVERITAVWALLADLTGPGPLVGVLPDGRPGDPSVGSRQERLTVVVVGHIRPLVLEVVVDDLADLLLDADRALAELELLKGRIGFRPVPDVEVGWIRVRLVVLNVEGPDRTQSHARARQDEPADVLRRRVLVTGEVIRDPPDSIAEYGLVAGTSVLDLRDVDLPIEIRFDRVDGLAPLEKHP